MSSDNSARLCVRGQNKEVSLKVGQSVLDAALAQGMDLDHACGGVCACSTCHIKVERGAECFNEASEDELDQLDTARDVALNSRLSCQAKLERMPSDGMVEIVIPTWNVNMIKEGH